MKLTGVIAIFLAALFPAGAQPGGGSFAEHFRRLTAGNEWKLISSTPLKFNAHHTQGVVKLGDNFYMTAVEVKRWPVRYSKPGGKYDRDTGEGIGHLLKFNGQGELLEDVILGEGPVYHPGGLDSDGRYLWIPVCEYRPFGPSIIYKVDIQTMKPVKAFTVDDAIGAVAVDPESGVLLGANWGSRGFYRWSMDKNGEVKDTAADIVTNPSFYIDYQDCHCVGKGLALCSGLKNYASGEFERPFTMGGLDLVNMEDLRPVHQVPLNLRTRSGKVMTNNPVWLETTGSGVRAFFIPEDDRDAVLYIYETVSGL